MQDRKSRHTQDRNTEKLPMKRALRRYRAARKLMASPASRPTAPWGVSSPQPRLGRSSPSTTTWGFSPVKHRLVVPNPSTTAWGFPTPQPPPGGFQPRKHRLGVPDPTLNHHLGVFTAHHLGVPNPSTTTRGFPTPQPPPGGFPPSSSTPTMRVAPQTLKEQQDLLHRSPAMSPYSHRAMPVASTSPTMCAIW